MAGLASAQSACLACRSNCRCSSALIWVWCSGLSLERTPNPTPGQTRTPANLQEKETHSGRRLSVCTGAKQMPHLRSFMAGETAPPQPEFHAALPLSGRNSANSGNQTAAIIMKRKKTAARFWAGGCQTGEGTTCIDSTRPIDTHSNYVISFG